MPESGSFFAFMGGVDMDIPVADVPERVVSLDLTAVMGGIEIRVPRDFTIVSPIFHALHLVLNFLSAVGAICVIPSNILATGLTGIGFQNHPGDN